jgi:hypothetical protein
VSEDDDGSFLGRWARRKAQVQQEARAVEAPAPETPAPDAQAVVSEDEKAEAEPFDLASLPSLDAIDATTDVSIFLRREVPEWLRNAALQKAWAADPAIRDYVNPAMEYAYDWNAPGGVPGSGALEVGHNALQQAMDMLSQPPGESGAPPHTLVDRTSAGAPEVVENAAPQHAAPPPDPLRLSDASAARGGEENDEKTEPLESVGTAPAVAASTAPAPAAPSRRRHGGAAPV